MFLKKGVLKKFRIFHSKIPLLESPFIKVAGFSNTPHVFLILEPKIVDFLANCSQKVSSFKVILIECVHRILFWFSPSVK